ncbi:hypothetical protein YC2023_059737 [Brassica napus]
MISYTILNSGLVFNLHIKLLKQKDPPQKPGFCILLGQKVSQGSMICVDNDFRPNQVALELLKGKNNCQHLLLCCGIPYLSIIDGLAGIVDHMGFAIFLLPQNSSHSIVTSVTHDLRREIPIRWLDNWSTNEFTFQLLESL